MQRFWKLDVVRTDSRAVAALLSNVLPIEYTFVRGLHRTVTVVEHFGIMDSSVVNA